MRESFRNVVQALVLRAKGVVGSFHLIADPNWRLDEARRLEQDVGREKMGILSGYSEC